MEKSIEKGDHLDMGTTKRQDRPQPTEADHRKWVEIAEDSSPPQSPSFLVAKWPQVRTRCCLSGFFPASNLAPATDEKWGIVRNPHIHPVNIRDILQVSSILVRLRSVHFSHTYSLYVSADSWAVGKPKIRRTNCVLVDINSRHKLLWSRSFSKLVKSENIHEKHSLEIVLQTQCSFMTEWSLFHVK